MNQQVVLVSGGDGTPRYVVMLPVGMMLSEAQMRLIHDAAEGHGLLAECCLEVLALESAEDVVALVGEAITAQREGI